MSNVLTKVQESLKRLENLKLKGYGMEDILIVGSIYGAIVVLAFFMFFGDIYMSLKKIKNDGEYFSAYNNCYSAFSNRNYFSVQKGKIILKKDSREMSKLEFFIFMIKNKNDVIIKIK